VEGVSVLVPRRVADEQRERVWAWLAKRLRRDGWDVREGWHTEDEGLFNRSAAINRAAVGSDADVFVIADADTLVGRAQIESAVRIARATGTLTFGFHRYAALSEEGTEAVLDGYDGSWEPYVELEFINTASSCVVVRRDLWDRLGGFDERFVGWGWEDVAFSLAAQTLGGGMHRVAGTAWHLWHPQGPDAGNDQSPVWKANRERWRPYDAAFHDEAAMVEALRR
jgi:GT2 family glycosyltransferase